MVFSSQRFFLCGGSCASQNTVCRNAAIVPCFSFSIAHSNSPGSLRLCVGACSSLQPSMHSTHYVLQVICAWNCNSAQDPPYCCLESASSFPSDHILNFPYTEQTYLVSTSLFWPCFDYFPNFSQ